MEVVTHELSKMQSPRHAEMNAELEALRQARDQLKVECTELQSKNDNDLSDDESRRYATLCNAMYLCHMFHFLLLKLMYMILCTFFNTGIAYIFICTFMLRDFLRAS